MIIELKSLTLSNFKGIHKLHVDFSFRTDISGANATGKTTIFDAFSWLLFDKDSLNRKDFGIKTYSELGDTLHGVDHSVEGVLDLEGQELRLKKVYAEKWTKKRGAAAAEFTGHTTEYWIQDVPVKQKDYQKRIESIIPEDRFKLLTNPLHFNEVLDWRDRREVLLSLVSEVTDEDVFIANPDLEPLKKYKLPVAEIQTLEKANATRLNKEIAELPTRIDELTKMKADLDFKALEKERDRLKEELQKATESHLRVVDSLADNKSIMGSMGVIQVSMNSVASLHKGEYHDKKTAYERELASCQETLRSLNDKKGEINAAGEALHEVLQGLRNDYVTIDGESYAGEANCPTCGQGLPESQVEEARAKHNQRKSERLEGVTRQGKAANEKLEALNAELVLVQEAREAAEEKYRALQENPIGDMPNFPKRYYDYQKELDELEKKLIAPPDDFALLEEAKGRLDTELKAVEAKLLFREQNERADERIEEYRAEAKKLGKEYEEAQYYLGLCDEFTKTHVDLVTAGLNKHFEQVRFKLFEVQINGGINPTCEALIDGVPYSDVNRAAKINTGIEIIKALSRHYTTSAPIFVDNAEAINQISDTDSQLIRLIVTEDKELVIA